MLKFELEWRANDFNRRAREMTNEKMADNLWSSSERNATKCERQSHLIETDQSETRMHDDATRRSEGYTHSHTTTKIFAGQAHAWGMIGHGNTYYHTRTRSSSTMNVPCRMYILWQKFLSTHSLTHFFLSALRDRLICSAYLVISQNRAQPEIPDRNDWRSIPKNSLDITDDQNRKSKLTQPSLIFMHQAHLPTLRVFTPRKNTRRV